MPALRRHVRDRGHGDERAERPQPGERRRDLARATREEPLGDDGRGEHGDEHQPLQPRGPGERDPPGGERLVPEGRPLDADADREQPEQERGDERVLGHQRPRQDEARQEQRQGRRRERPARREEAAAPEVDGHRRERHEHRVQRLRDRVDRLGRRREPGRRDRRGVDEADRHVVPADEVAAVLLDAPGELAVQELVAEDERVRNLAREQRAYEGRDGDQPEEDERWCERARSD